MKNSSSLMRRRHPVGHAQRQPVRSPDVTADVLDDERQTEGQQQAVHRVTVVDPADHQPLHDEAEQRGRQRRDQQRAPEADRRRQHECEIAAQSQEVAMREVDDVAEVQDQRKTERHQHVERTDDQPIGYIEQDDLQHEPRSLAAPVRDGPAAKRRRGSRTARDCYAGGSTILQPVDSTLPAAFSPGTIVSTVNTLSGLPCGGCA